MPDTFVIFISFLFGLCFGSFSNVIIYRLPRGESIAAPPSHCIICGRALSVFDLIPLLSWVLLKGRCRYCGARISPRYPAVELCGALLFAAAAWRMGPSGSLIPLCLLAFVLLNVSVIDFKTMEIPDGLLIFGATTGALWVAASAFFADSALFSPPAPSWQNALLGALAGAAPLFLIDRLTLLLVKKDGFGYGDMKLMAMGGWFLGWELTMYAFFFAFAAGGLYAAFLLLSGRAKKGTYLAFGPFLSAGMLAAVFIPL